jgi:hypothetical protein
MAARKSKEYVVLIHVDTKTNNPGKLYISKPPVIANYAYHS